MKEWKAFYETHISVILHWQQWNDKMDTNSADEKRTRINKKRDVFSTLRPFTLNVTMYVCMNVKFAKINVEIKISLSERRRLITGV